jgi:hypothetical protein
MYWPTLERMGNSACNVAKIERKRLRLKVVNLVENKMGWNGSVWVFSVH